MEASSVLEQLRKSSKSQANSVYQYQVQNDMILQNSSNAKLKWQKREILEWKFCEPLCVA
jgi:hypothetical protein